MRPSLRSRRLTEHGAWWILNDSAMAALLVTFAVKEEAVPFQRLLPSRRDLRVLITGIGQRNAEDAIRRSFANQLPGSVLTCGFAGGLNPELSVGSVVFSADNGFELVSALASAGARPATFHCADRVAVTVEEKRILREKTGADAVEMESGVVRDLCRKQGIPSVTVRAISDTAVESLPLDFNLLMGAGQKLSHRRLMMALLTSPGRIPALLRLQRQTRTAAENLAAVLAKVTVDRAPAR